MKIQSNLFWKSFLISFAVFALLAGIIVASVYIDSISVDPMKKESNVLLGIQEDGEIIALMVLHLDPKNSVVSFLQIPDNTLLSDGRVLQKLYQRNKAIELIEAIEDLIGTDIHRYAVFSTDAVCDITNGVGKIEYLIPYKFIYNDFEHSGQTYMYGELAKAMFTYGDYDMTKVSMSYIADSYLHSFLSKHANSATVNKLAATLTDKGIFSGIDTNLDEKEISEYCAFLAKYSSLTQKNVAIEGTMNIASTNRYFTPNVYKTDKNIFE